MATSNSATCFTTPTPEDFLYFLLFVMQEQKLNPDQDPVTIWGDLTHDSALFDIMRKYVRHVRLGKKPTKPNVFP